MGLALNSPEEGRGGAGAITAIDEIPAECFI